MTVRGHVFRVGTLNGRQVAVGRSGTGKVNAAIVATLLDQPLRSGRVVLLGHRRRDRSHAASRRRGDRRRRRAARHRHVTAAGIERRGLRNPVTGELDPILLPAPDALLAAARAAAAGLTLPPAGRRRWTRAEDHRRRHRHRRHVHIGCRQARRAARQPRRRRRRNGRRGRRPGVPHVRRAVPGDQEHHRPGRRPGDRTTTSCSAPPPARTPRPWSPPRSRGCRKPAGPSAELLAAQDVAIRRLVERHDPFGAVPRPDDVGGGLAHVRAPLAVGEQLDRRGRPSPARDRGAQRNPVTPSSMISGRPPTREATTGTSQAIASSAARPKLSCADGSRKRSRGRQPRHQVLLLAHELDVRRQAVRRDAALDVGTHRPVADQHEPRADAVAGCGGRRRRPASTRLTGRKFETCMTSASRRPAGQQPGPQRRIEPAPILAAVEEIRDDADRDAHAERRRWCRRAGSRDTAVTPCDCSIENATTRAYDGSLPTSVMSVPCSVVTVRGGGDRRRRGEDLIGQVGGRRVRHRVVGVHDVELVLLGDAHDGVGERQQVLRLAKQRIRRHARPARTTGPATPSRHRNGGSLLIRCTP